MRRRTLWMGLALLGALGAAAAAGPGCAPGAEAGGGGDDNDDGGGGDDGPADAGADGPGDMDAAPVGCSTAADCSELDGPCAEGACVDGTCVAEPANEFASCNDDKFCTQDDVCVNGACVGGSVKPCPSQDPCHIGYCEEMSGACVNVVGNDGAQCDDMDPCTGYGVCSNGTCQPGPPVDC